MQTILTIHYNEDGTIYLKGYDWKGADFDLKDLQGKVIKNIGAMYDDILVETEDD